MNIKDYIHFYPNCMIIVDGQFQGKLTAINNEDCLANKTIKLTGPTVEFIMLNQNITVSIDKIKPILNQIGDMTDEQVLHLALLAFSRSKINWKITRKDKSGFWLDGSDHLGILYYFRINDYFEIYASTTFPKEKDKEKQKFDKTLGSIDNSWKYGVPYAVLFKQLTDWEFDVFHLVRHKLAHAKGIEIKLTTV